jgi:glycerophosphoryl diester phosphodiesterase
VTKVIAHRGASAVRPENTVEAYRYAKVLGADMVELDARRTADDSVWVLHDEHLADGRALVDTEPADLPPQVPSLAVALAACEGMDVNIEVKNVPIDGDWDPDERVARATVELVQELGMQDRVLVSSFGVGAIDTVHDLDPSIPTAFLTPFEVTDDVLDQVVGKGHVALHPHEAFVDEGLIQRCHALGLAVNCWTLDDPARMELLVGWGIDGICTNVPDVARKVVDAAR